MSSKRILPTLVFLLSGVFLSASSGVSAQHDESPWLDTAAHNGIVYLVDNARPHIDRFDMNAQGWLDPIPLPAAPTAFAVDADGIVVATGRSVYTALPHATKFDFLTNTQSEVRSIALGAGSIHLSLAQSPYYIALDRASGAEQRRREHSDDMQDTVFSARQQRVFGRTAGVYPASLVSIDLTDDNEYSRLDRSPHHGDYPHGTKLYLYPDENFLLDNIGMVYSLPELVWAGSVAGQVNGAVFDRSELFTLSGSLIRRLSDEYLETGRYTLEQEAHALYSQGALLFAFHHDGLSPQAQRVRKVLVNTDSEPANVALDSPFRGVGVIPRHDGSLMILSKEPAALYRYDPAERQYVDAIALRGEPAAFALQPDSDYVLVGYNDGAITRINLTTGTEVPFFNVAGIPEHMLAMDTGLLVSDLTGSSRIVMTVDGQGNVLDFIDGFASPQAAIWMAATREVLGISDFFLSAQYIPLGGSLAENQRIGNSHPEYIPPLIPDMYGTRILTGDGTIYDYATLDIQGALANAIFDAIWLDESMLVSLAQENHYYWYDAESTDIKSLALQTWGVDQEPLKNLPFEALHSLLVSTDTGVFLVINRKNRQPRIVELDLHGPDTDGDGYSDDVDELPLDPDQHIVLPDTPESGIIPDRAVTEVVAGECAHTSVNGDDSGQVSVIESACPPPEDNDADLPDETPFIGEPAAANPDNTNTQGENADAQDHDEPDQPVSSQNRASGDTPAIRDAAGSFGLWGILALCMLIGIRPGVRARA